MNDQIGNIITNLKEKNIKFLRLQFVDIHGTPKNMAVPINNEDQILDIIDNGLLFDGSSVDGFADISDSDLILKPELSTYSCLPWRPEDKGTARFICNIYHTDGKTPYEGDPRYVLRKAVEKVEKLGYKYNVGPEPEFFIVDKDEYGNLIPHDKGTYFDVEPVDQGTDFRRQLVLDLELLGFDIELSHHEVAPGQHEIDFRFGDALKTADAVITFKQAIKAIVDNMGYKVTFMPKPFFNESGSGMHINQSLFDKKGNNIFDDPSTETGLSKEAMYFTGGLLKHCKALSAVCAPIVNSYKRLVPGYEAPVYISYGFKNRSALVRIPASRGKRTRVELRMPDPSCNPYLAFATVLEAGMDGIKNKIDPGEPTEMNLFGKTSEELEKLGIEFLPTSLWEAYHSLEKDTVVQAALGKHVYEKFYNMKRAEWDDYRIQVFTYEQDKYLNI